MLMQWLTMTLSRLRDDESGQDLVEYALLVVLIALALVAFLPGVADAIQAVFQNIIDTLGGVTT